MNKFYIKMLDKVFKEISDKKGKEA
jgi:hypothetical protein